MLLAVGALCLLAFAAAPAHASKHCCNAAGEAACITACASVLGMPVCMSDACYGPNGCDFSPSCGSKDRRLEETTDGPDFGVSAKINAAVSARKLSGKRCGNAAGEAACVTACASVVGMPICLSDACYGPNGPDFSPSCK